MLRFIKDVFIRPWIYSTSYNIALLGHLLSFIFYMNSWLLYKSSWYIPDFPPTIRHKSCVLDRKSMNGTVGNMEQNGLVPAKKQRLIAKQPVTVVLGTQWGDEGKGKIVDMIAADADICCRCQVCFISCIRIFLFTILHWWSWKGSYHFWNVLVLARSVLLNKFMFIKQDIINFQSPSLTFPGLYINLASPDAITNEIKCMSPNCSFKTWIKKMLS